MDKLATKIIATEAYEAIFEANNREKTMKEGININKEADLVNEGSTNGMNNEIFETPACIDATSKELMDMEAKHNINTNEEF